MNQMHEVAKLLGVELDEEFEVVFPQPSDCHATVKLTLAGAIVIDTNVYDIFNFKSYLLQDLVRGCYDIKRKPWKPKREEKYWYVIPDGRVRSTYFTNATFDCMAYKLGNCYRTEKEAVSKKDKWTNFFESDEALSI